MTLINTLSAPTAIPACRPILPSCSGAAEESPEETPVEPAVPAAAPSPAPWPAGWWCWMVKPKAATCALAWAGPLGLDKDGTPVTLSADAPLSLRQAVLVYDGEAKTYTLLPGSSQELCYLGDTALLEPQELAGGGEPAPGHCHAEIRALLRPGFQLVGVAAWQVRSYF